MTEEDAVNIIAFLNANYLVANPNKTKVLLFRPNESSSNADFDNPFSIQIENSLIEESMSEKLLGIHISNNLRWDHHINEVKSSVNQRIAVLKHVSYHIPRESLRELAFGLVLSKIRYGIPVYGIVRMQNDDPHTKGMQSLDVSINDTMRIMYGSSRHDRISIEMLRESMKIPSINQMAAEATLLETWRIRRLGDDSELIKPISSKGMITRGQTAGNLEVPMGGQERKRSFSYQAPKLWNAAPIELRACEGKGAAKKIIRTFASSLP